jgi:6-phosphofructokinase 1
LETRVSVWVLLRWAAMTATIHAQSDFRVEHLGECRHVAPPAWRGNADVQFISDDARVALDIECSDSKAAPLLYVEQAGPRAQLYFEPSRARAAIVTCGGLCPGINNVVRAIVLELHHHYRVPSIVGFRYGYEGLDPDSRIEPVPLGPEQVCTIHRSGGNMLGMSRGKHAIAAIVDALIAHEIDMLFTIGGDGTLSGAYELHAEIARRGVSISIVGLPKTIDNDIPFIDKALGFDTAVELARSAVDAAHAEATSARNGIGLVKLMGRDSGFIAASATLASSDVNICLIPEVPFNLGGAGGLLAALEQRLAERSHAVVVVAEGCGASLAGPQAERDLSGNLRYASHNADIGTYLRDTIVEHFRARAIPISLKYIDPSYMIRSVPANAMDSILCDELGRHAVHAALAGKTGILIGRVHGTYAHLPLSVVTKTRKRIDPNGAH